MADTGTEIHQLLEMVANNLRLALSERQFQQLAMHFALLLRWNEKINLTAIRKPEAIATRHFEESLFLTTLIKPPDGLLVDVGSGAGFPGLPLKIAWPAVETVLLEPNNKKASFLKEAIRQCGLERIEVRTERLEDTVRGNLAGRAALVTLRALAPTGGLLAALEALLAPAGQLALFLGSSEASVVAAGWAAPVPSAPPFVWQAPSPLPRSERRVILIGQRHADAAGHETVANTP